MWRRCTSPVSFRPRRPSNNKPGRRSRLSVSKTHAMRKRTATCLSLTLLLAAAVGVWGAPAKARAASKTQASSSSKTRARSHRARRSRSARGQKAPEPARISEIQAALAKDGSFAGTPNGKWDASTVEALKKYQEAHSLNPSGKLDAKTLQSLGLGSQTAGAAAPMPPVSSSALRASPPPAVPHKR